MQKFIDNKMEQNNNMVSISFNFSDVNVNNINVNSNKHFDPNEIAEESIGNSTSFKYAGRHDHGDLPKLKSNGKFSYIYYLFYIYNKF
jgi:hypothetical protein